MWWAWVSTIGAGVVSACRRDRKQEPESTPTPAPAAPPVTDFAAAMAVLVRTIGPWTPADEEIARLFIQRYLAHRAERFKASEPAIIRLAQLVPAGGRVETFTLAGMPEDERKVLDALLDDVFSRAEIRWYLSGVLHLPGVCLGPAT
jgi:hypothetical protein